LTRLKTVYLLGDDKGGDGIKGTIAMTPNEWESEQSLIAGYARSGEMLFAQ